MSLQNFGLRNSCLRICLKSHVSVQSRTFNMWQPPKHCFYIHKSRFIKFFYKFGKISVAKVLSEKYLKFQERLLAYWLPMKSVFNSIQMKLYKKLKIFPQFLTPFLKCRCNFEHFGKKDESHSLCPSKSNDCEIGADVNI